MQKTRANTQAEPDNTEQRFFHARTSEECYSYKAKMHKK